MEKEVQSKEDAVVGQVVVNVEQTAVQTVFDDCPDAKAGSPVGSKLEHAGQTLACEVGAVCDRGQPDGWDDPPRSLAQWLKEVAEKRSRISTLIVSWSVYLLEVEVLAEAAVPDLH